MSKTSVSACFLWNIRVLEQNILKVYFESIKFLQLKLLYKDISHPYIKWLLY